MNNEERVRSYFLLVEGVREILGAGEDEGILEAAERVVRERDAAQAALHDAISQRIRAGLSLYDSTLER